jgi:putative FmdB family regulatory protein
LPLYEYECPKDGRFELVRKFSDPPLTRCPTCGTKIEKIPSAPAIQFKGSGWYITDYARKSSGDGKDAGKDGGKEGTKDAATSDKSAAKETTGKDSPAKDSTKSTKKTGGGESKSSA